ncbi:hypothetical protein, conserved [Leishmania tarentolae]|uniref:Uncharacterized protein n=1 Tax=Leishmania tarentolae TaxID=5689 RepID=A0A640KT47_LEITA|nr:hypothetical protein, conserved [Leishmania tarentolae]
MGTSHQCGPHFLGLAAPLSPSSTPDCCIRSSIECSRSSIRELISSIREIMDFDISSKRACICCISRCTCVVTSCVPPWGCEWVPIAADEAAAAAGAVAVVLGILLLRAPVAFGGIVEMTIVGP